MTDKTPREPLERELAALERRTWRSQGDDGLGDLLLGLAIGAFGLGMATHEATLAAIAPALFVMQWKPLRRLLVEPRRGRAVPLPARRRSTRRALLAMVALQVALVLLGVGAWLTMASPSGRAALGDLMPALIQLPAPAILFALGWWFEQPRFLGDGAAGVLLVAGLHAAGAQEGWALVALGALLAAQGLVLLVRFFRAHPRVANGEA